jgi:hypothetical protein
MRINIGPYRSDLIPVYSWERRYDYMRMAQTDNYSFNEDDYTWYDKVVYGIFSGLSTLFRPLNRWSNSRKRRVKVHIDEYDVWSADHTLSMIIAPLLKKLKETKNGVPFVDNDDVPEELHVDKKDDNEWTDEDHINGEAKWEWVLDEMIWTFDQYAMPNDDDQFYHNVDQLEILFKPFEDKKGWNSVKFNHQKDSTKPAYWVDHEGKKKHHERKANGLRLFAKYYENLWD